MKQVIALSLIALVIGCSKERYTRLEKKSIGKDFVKVTDSLYASATEVSNAEYTRFLLATKAAGDEGLFNQYNFDTVKWKKVLAFNEPLIEYYHDHPAYKDYPAVNISYEGAVAYCNWLTEEYAKNPKRKHKKVTFRLPTEEEWKLAARGNREGYIFPWGGPYMRNSRGLFFANFQHVYEGDLKDTVVKGEKRAIEVIELRTETVSSLNDNGIVTTPVRAYWTNHLGLYNMAGNVSEMLAEKGKTKGGNWNSLGYYLRIDAPDEFDGQMMEPSPLVGFRVFAEIVEN